MGLGTCMQTALLLLLFLDIQGAQVLATEKSAGADIDIKYALIGTALGVVISAGFLVLKICMIKKHLCDNKTPEPESTQRGFNNSRVRKKRELRPNFNFSKRPADVIEL